MVCGISLSFDSTFLFMVYTIVLKRQLNVESGGEMKRACAEVDSVNGPQENHLVVQIGFPYPICTKLGVH